MKIATHPCDNRDNRDNRRSPLQAAAYHEAGHVVAALAQGCPSEGATIVSNDDSTGMAYMRLLYLEDFQRGIVCVAGAVSEMLIEELPLSGTALTAISHGATNDFVELDKLKVDEGAVFEQCEKILTAAWPLVEVIAKRLIEVGALDGNQIAEMAQKFEDQKTSQT